jgi:hypothetical protein
MLSSPEATNSNSCLEAAQATELGVLVWVLVVLVLVLVALVWVLVALELEME